ncbi:MAG: hypothetical protein WDZ79_00150 [Candidatus Paceibacterota bacterium]
MDTSLRTKTVVEFIGVAGSGKTTLAARATERLGDEGYRTEGRRETFRGGVAGRLGRYLYYAGYLVRHFAPLAGLFVLCRARVRIRTIWPLFKKIVAQYKICTSEGDVIVFDQGVVNSLLDGSSAHPQWHLFFERYARAIGIDRIGIVFIEIDPEVARSRAQTRASKGHWSERESAEAIRERFSLYEDNARALLSGASVARLVLRGEAGIEENVERIVSFIRRLVDEK